MQPSLEVVWPHIEGTGRQQEVESRYPGMEVNPQSAHSQRRASGWKDMTSQRIRQGVARERRMREPRRQPQDARTVRAGLQHPAHRFGHSVRNGGVVPEGGALIVLDEIQACGGHRWEDGRNRIGAPPHQLHVVADSYPRCQKQHSMV